MESCQELFKHDIILLWLNLIWFPGNMCYNLNIEYLKRIEIVSF